MNEIRIKKKIAGVLLLVSAQLLIQSCTNNNRLPQLGSNKIENVIAAMTPDEKIGMSVGDGKFLPAAISKTTEQGTGIIIANQNSKMVIPRLLVRSSALTDGPSGVNRIPILRERPNIPIQPHFQLPPVSPQHGTPSWWRT